MYVTARVPFCSVDSASKPELICLEAFNFQRRSFFFEKFGCVAEGLGKKDKPLSRIGQRLRRQKPKRGVYATLEPAVMQVKTSAICNVRARHVK